MGSLAIQQPKKMLISVDNAQVKTGVLCVIGLAPCCGEEDVYAPRPPQLRTNIKSGKVC